MEELALYLDSQKKRGASSTYMKVLSQHSSQKPKSMGGAPNPGGVNPLCQVTKAGRGQVRVEIPLPNSFMPVDGLQLVFGPDEDAAKESAARHVVAILLFQNPPEVRLLDKDWHAGAEEIRQQAARIAGFTGPQRAAGPMSGLPLSKTKKYPGYQVPAPFEDREAEKRDLLTRIIQFHHQLKKPEDPDPSRLHRGKAQWIPDLDRLFQPNTLRQWIENSREFKVIPHVIQVGGNHFKFTFAGANPLPIAAIGATEVAAGGWLVNEIGGTGAAGSSALWQGGTQWTTEADPSPAIGGTGAAGSAIGGLGGPEKPHPPKPFTELKFNVVMDQLDPKANIEAMFEALQGHPSLAIGADPPPTTGGKCEAAGSGHWQQVGGHWQQVGGHLQALD
jgi:hypothetical protein